MSVIILEGPDGAGKSTLARELMATTPTAALHNHGPYRGQVKVAHHYLRSLYAGLLKPDRLTILDRAWVSEPIYGDAVRDGANRITPAERRTLVRVALGAGAVVVLCLPPLEICVAAWRGRLGAEYLKKKTQLEAVHAGYRRWFDSPERWDGPPVLRYDWTDRSGDRLPIEKRIDRVLADAANTGPGIGSWRHATSLLIGDRANRRPGGRDRLPFCSLLRTGCSAWLADRLEAWGVPERSLYWVNQHTLDVAAFGEGGPVDRFDRIVALGKNAEAWCARNAVPCTPVEHPQYWKRFHSSAEYPLKDVLA